MFESPCTYDTELDLAAFICILYSSEMYNPPLPQLFEPSGTQAWISQSWFRFIPVMSLRVHGLGHGGSQTQVTVLKSTRQLTGERSSTLNCGFLMPSVWLACPSVSDNAVCWNMENRTPAGDPGECGCTNAKVGFDSKMSQSGCWQCWQCPMSSEETSKCSNNFDNVRSHKVVFSTRRGMFFLLWDGNLTNPGWEFDMPVGCALARSFKLRVVEVGHLRSDSEETTDGDVHGLVPPLAGGSYNFICVL